MISTVLAIVFIWIPYVTLLVNVYTTNWGKVSRIFFHGQIKELNGHMAMFNSYWENIMLVGGLEHFLFFHILGIIIKWLSYFSEGLKPPTSMLVDQRLDQLGLFSDHRRPRKLCSYDSWIQMSQIPIGWLMQKDVVNETPPKKQQENDDRYYTSHWPKPIFAKCTWLILDRFWIG